MKYPVNKPTPTSDKVVVFTGGVKEDVAQVELRPGELIDSLNVEEIDGVYHGYASLPGYERFSGLTKASDIPVTSVVDRGIDVNTQFLLESHSQDTIVDLSFDPRTVANDSVINDSSVKKFLSSSYYFNGAALLQVTDAEGNLNFGSEDFTLDTLVTPQSPITTNILMQRGGCYAFLIENGHLVFKYSTDGISWTDTLISSTLIVSGTEYHVAVVREDDTVRFAIDGSWDVNTMNIGADAIFDSTDYLIIGQWFEGWMDEVRISSSIRWHNSFDIPTRYYSITDYYEYQFNDDAREAQRALILKVPGDGSILGISTNEGNLIACRDNIGATAGYFFGSTVSGWSAALAGAYTIDFSSGVDTDSPYYPGLQIGDTITGVISGETAVVVCLASQNDWELGTATGTIVLRDESGAFTDGENFTSGTVTITSDAGTYQEFVLDPGGNYQFLNARFDGFLTHQRESVTFFANGKNSACFYKDSGAITPIIHTNLPDNDVANPVYPTHVIEFKNRLWLAYPNGRLWYSGAGSPLDFDVATGGAGEIYMEDEITGLQVAPGDVLVVFGRNSIQMIKSVGDVQGTSSDTQMDYKFLNESYSKRSGCIAKTNERILGVLMFLDDRGLTELEATDAFGDFTYNSLSKNVQRTILKQKTAVLGSLVDRVKNQYRLFFDDKTGIIFTFDMEKKVKGATFFKYNHIPTFLHDGEDVAGYAHKYMGTADGYVMQIDSGTSFDGEEIPTRISTAFYHYGTPTKWKRFRKATLEGQAEKDLVIHGRADFNYKDPRLPGSNEIQYTTTATGGIWGYDSWGVFQYGSGAAEAPSLFIQGYGVNMGLVLTTSNKYTEPHIYNSITVEYSIDGRKR